MKNIAFIFAVLLTAQNVQALETSNAYMGFQYSMLTYNEPPYGDWNPTVLLGRYGVNLDQGTAIEGRFGVGLDSDSKQVTDMGIDLDVEIDDMMGIYFVGKLPISNKAEAYGLIGATRISMTATASFYSISATASDTDTDISYGLGANFALNDKALINIEYMNYYDKEGVKIDALAFGVTFALAD